MRKTLLLFILPLLTGMAAPQEAPSKLENPGKWGIGKEIDNFSFQTLAGEKGTLSDYLPAVLAFTAVDCPLSKLYRPRINRLEEEYKKKGIRFLYIYCDFEDKPVTAQTNIPSIHDREGKLTRLLLAKRTTDAFLIDKNQILRYRGAIDDQYGIGYKLDRPRETYLTDAIDSILLNKPIAIPATEAPGCPIQLEPIVKAPQQVTFYRDVLPILQKNCQSCHRPGEIGPFPLMSYNQVRRRARRVQEAVNEKRMPPWFANDIHGTWKNDARLSPKEIDSINTWIANGTPEGTEADAPPVPPFITGWQIGKPDIVFTMRKKSRIPAEGIIPYRHYSVKTNFKEDRWIQAIEVRPGDPKVVHHILVFDRAPGEKQKFLGGLKGFFGGMVPGTKPITFQKGYAKKLKAGSTLIFQMHYTPIGEERWDQSKIGLIFAKEPVRHEVKTAGISTRKLQIPPHEGNHREEATYHFRKEARIYRFLPHMHVRGKSFRYEAIYPDGRREILLDIPKYDFNWQLSYELEAPLLVPPGTKIRAIAHFDNSEANPANPDPNATVRFGPQTFDEMLIGYFDYTEVP